MFKDDSIAVMSENALNEIAIDFIIAEEIVKLYLVQLIYVDHFDNHKFV